MLFSLALFVESFFSNNLCGPLFIIFGLKAIGFLVLIFFLASRIEFWNSGVLWQFLQVQNSSQYLPWVKHSQYIFRHLLLLHLQVRFFTLVVFCLITLSCESLDISDYLFLVFSEGPRVFLLPIRFRPYFSFLPLSCIDEFKIESSDNSFLIFCCYLDSRFFSITGLEIDFCFLARVGLGFSAIS